MEQKDRKMLEEIEEVMRNANNEDH